jgi:antitoxin (DNA-binding transcriptional repressor) of toxin-antitoxin stability system
MITATIFEAKTGLSELIKKAQNGETVIITSGKEKTPVARLEAMEPKKKKRLGAMETPGFVLGDAFWEPLTDEEMGLAGGEELL